MQSHAVESFAGYSFRAVSYADLRFEKQPFPNLLILVSGIQCKEKIRQKIATKSSNSKNRFAE